MDEQNFQKFLSAYSSGISEKQSERIESRFNGSFSTEHLVAEILAEVHICINDYLKAYNHWLFENYDIRSKNP